MNNAPDTSLSSSHDDQVAPGGLRSLWADGAVSRHAD